MFPVTVAESENVDALVGLVIIGINDKRFIELVKCNGLTSLSELKMFSLK